MKADRLTYCEKCSDGSAVEFSVEYVNEPYLHDKNIKGAITIHHVDSATFPITKLDWLIECLQRVKAEVEKEL